MELAPAALGELPSPIKPHRKEKWRLQIGNQTEQPIMQLPSFRYQFTHNPCLCSFLAAFLTAHIFIGPSEPAQSWPSLNRALNECCPLGPRDPTAKQSSCASQALSTGRSVRDWAFLLSRITWKLLALRLYNDRESDPECAADARLRS
jgi:hypothetical protein